MSQRLPEGDYLGTGTFSLCVYKSDLLLKDTGLMAEKAIPLQAWTGPEGPRSLKLPDFETIGT